MIKDSVDQKFDMSGVLNSDLSFMPVPIIIMEPAVGYGGGKITIGSHWGR